MLLGKIFISIFLVNILAFRVAAEKILVLVPIGSKSHKNVIEPLYKALAARGHDITVVSPVKPSKPQKNIREIVPVPLKELFGDFNVFELRNKSFVGKVTTMASYDFITGPCNRTYNNQEFMSLLKEEFHLVFLVGFFNDCFAGFLYKLGAPFIMVTTGASPGAVAELVGNRLPTSFVPMPVIPGLTDDMTFGQRTKNFLIANMFQVLKSFAPSTSRFEAIYRKALGEDVPGYVEIERNVSMIFSNSYFPLTYPRPLLPDIVEVGGMHCRPAKPLPKDLDEFLTGAKHGFIYFSMGSVLQTDQMPDEMRQKFLNVFSRLKQRVLWKWNSGEMPNLPSNVKLSSWLPQQDILGHPNIRIFMTHGGLLSTQEAAYHGVPLIAIPMAADQDANAHQAVTNGYALSMEILELTEELLESLINQILNDSKYSNRAKQLSAVILDQMETPLERAVFWSEYVIRHRGAVHLRSAARKLNFIQYHSIDVFSFLSSVLIVILTVLVMILKLLYRKVCKRGNTADETKKRQ